MGFDGEPHWQGCTAPTLTRHTCDVAGQMMVPSSPGGPDMVVCCTAATGLGRRSTSCTKPACAARWLAGTTLIIIIRRSGVGGLRVQNWEYTLRTIAMCSDHRTFHARTVHEVGCARVKGPESSGRGKDAGSVL